MLTMSRQAGLPIKTMTQEAFYAGLGEMAVSQGAARTGTATTSLFSQFVGGIMPKRVAEEMEKMDLLKPGEYHTVRGGGVVMKESASLRLGQGMTDPIGFITGTLNDIMTKKGMDDQQKILEIYRLFGRQTT